MNVKPARKHRSIVLAQETVRFGGMLLDYRLVASTSETDRFQIQISTGAEQAESGAGSDIEAALRAYRAVLRGRVTPCGLADVMYDLKSV